MKISKLLNKNCLSIILILLFGLNSFAEDQPVEDGTEIETAAACDSRGQHPAESGQASALHLHVAWFGWS